MFIIKFLLMTKCECYKINKLLIYIFLIFTVVIYINYYIIYVFNFINISKLK
jgi:hypothetical protein